MIASRKWTKRKRPCCPGGSLTRPWDLVRRGSWRLIGQYDRVCSDPRATKMSMDGRCVSAAGFASNSKMACKAERKQAAEM